jgi:hypothetical protein
MERLILGLFVPFLIFVLLIGLPDTYAVGKLKEVSLAVEGMT